MLRGTKYGSNIWICHQWHVVVHEKVPLKFEIEVTKVNWKYYFKQKLLYLGKIGAKWTLEVWIFILWSFHVLDSTCICWTVHWNSKKFAKISKSCRGFQSSLSLEGCRSVCGTCTTKCKKCNLERKVQIVFGLLKI